MQPIARWQRTGQAGTVRSTPCPGWPSVEHAMQKIVKTKLSRGCLPAGTEAEWR